MRILAIDPGNEQSARLTYDTIERRPIHWVKEPNKRILHWLETAPVDVMALEMIASYGMAVGATVFETCVWSGRFIERWHLGHRQPYIPVYRRDVKLHLCGSQRAKDANIRQVLIDRYGPGKERAVGRKASPGPLYGMKADCWSTLAVAITAAETMLDPSVAA